MLRRRETRCKFRAHQREPCPRHARYSSTVQGSPYIEGVFDASQNRNGPQRLSSIFIGSGIVSLAAETGGAPSSGERGWPAHLLRRALAVLVPHTIPTRRLTRLEWKIGAELKWAPIHQRIIQRAKRTDRFSLLALSDGGKELAPARSDRCRISQAQRCRLHRTVINHSALARRRRALQSTR